MTNESNGQCHAFALGGTRKTRRKIAKLLINNSADVNAKTEYGDTPLHCGGAEKRGGGCETAD